MEKTNEVEHPDTRRDRCADFRLEVLDSRQGQHVGLRVCPNPVSDGLQSREHVVQRDTLLRPILVRREQFGSELCLFPWRVAPANRSGDSRGVEDAVAKCRDRLGRSPDDRCSRGGLEHEDVAAPIHLPKAGDDVDRVDMSIQVDIHRARQDRLGDGARSNRSERSVDRGFPTRPLGGGRSTCNLLGSTGEVSSRCEFRPKSLRPRTKALEYLVACLGIDHRSNTEPSITCAVSFELDLGKVKEPVGKVRPHTRGMMVGAKGETPVELHPRCPRDLARNKRATRDLSGGLGCRPEPIAVHGRVGDHLDRNPTVGDPPLAPSPETSRLAFCVPQKRTRTQIGRGYGDGRQAT